MNILKNFIELIKADFFHVHCIFSCDPNKGNFSTGENCHLHQVTDDVSAGVFICSYLKSQNIKQS